MIRYGRKAGYFLSFVALLWLIVPCENHCQWLTPVETSQSCPCESQEHSSKPISCPTNEPRNLMQICHLNSSSYLAPSSPDFTLLKLGSLGITIEPIQNIGDTNPADISHYESAHSPPIHFESQRLAVQLYSPHAPPTLI